MKHAIRLSVVVSSGTIRFRAEVQAESIEEAVRLAAGSHPGGEIKVLFPIDPKTFFAAGEGSAPQTIWSGGREARTQLQT